MTTTKPPDHPPPEDSLKKLAEFTKRILQVSKDDLRDSEASEKLKTREPTEST